MRVSQSTTSNPEPCMMDEVSLEDLARSASLDPPNNSVFIESACSKCGIDARLIRDHIVFLQTQLRAQYERSAAEAKLRHMHTQTLRLLIREVQELKAWRASIREPSSSVSSSNSVLRRLSPAHPVHSLFTDPGASELIKVEAEATPDPQVECKADELSLRLVSPVHIKPLVTHSEIRYGISESQTPLNSNSCQNIPSQNLLHQICQQSENIREPFLLTDQGAQIVFSISRSDSPSFSTGLGTSITSPIPTIHRDSIDKIEDRREHDLLLWPNCYQEPINTHSSLLKPSDFPNPPHSSSNISLRIPSLTDTSTALHSGSVILNEAGDSKQPSPCLIEPLRNFYSSYPVCTTSNLPSIQTPQSVTSAASAPVMVQLRHNNHATSSHSLPLHTSFQTSLAPDSVPFAVADVSEIAFFSDTSKAFRTLETVELATTHGTTHCHSLQKPSDSCLRATNYFSQINLLSRKDAKLGKVEEKSPLDTIQPGSIISLPMKFRPVESILSSQSEEIIHLDLPLSPKRHQPSSYSDVISSYETTNLLPPELFYACSLISSSTTSTDYFHNLDTAREIARIDTCNSIFDSAVSAPPSSLLKSFSGISSCSLADFTSSPSLHLIHSNIDKAEQHPGAIRSTTPLIPNLCSEPQVFAENMYGFSDSVHPNYNIPEGNLIDIPKGKISREINGTLIGIPANNLSPEIHEQTSQPIPLAQQMMKTHPIANIDNPPANASFQLGASARPASGGSFSESCLSKPDSFATALNSRQIEANSPNIQSFEDHLETSLLDSADEEICELEQLRREVMQLSLSSSESEPSQPSGSYGTSNSLTICDR
ncbi:unnamed protein product [Protopolystoma xenopodis]|uniref:Uncharacterized protein n=1 Tax=Protopolystoma xenopodis TaxID=117903 RepID=A0A3S5FBK5_9PLAT|nr:unnamed protein product [Protopolystoma xenopodis]